jgi:ADP-ribose pyrophosphatase YjhB (NUDIX family)
MAAQFCSQCGSRLIAGPLHGRERKYCPACGFIVYHNPAPVGLAVVERDGQLVLIRRTIPPLQGYWAPPAGHVEIGESVPEATIREVREETGLDITLEGLVGVYSQADVKVVIVAYRGRAVSGEPKAGEDAGEIALFKPGELPDQPFPADGTPTDRWLYGVIEAVTAPWREARIP